MKTIATIILISLCVLLNQSAIAQNNSGNKFRIHLNTGEKFEVKNAFRTSEGVTVTQSNGFRAHYQYVAMKSLHQWTGRKTEYGASLGAGIGLAGAIAILYAAIQEAEDSSNKELNKSAIIPVFALTIGIGAALGAIIGSSVSNWHKVPIKSSLSLNINNDRRLICLKCNF